MPVRGRSPLWVDLSWGTSGHGLPAHVAANGHGVGDREHWCSAQARRPCERFCGLI